MLRISIITIVLNDVKNLEYTMQKVFAQGYPNLEYIVIDGGSTDGTVQIIEKYNKNLTWWCSEPDNGIYDAMNKGISKANGDIIGIINSGDFLMPGALQAVEHIFNNHKPDLVHGNMLRFVEYPEFCTYDIKQPEKNPQNLKIKQTIFHPTCFVTKNTYNHIGGFCKEYKIAGDYEFLLRALENNCSFQYTDTIITAFRAGGASTSPKRFFELSKIAWSKNRVIKSISLIFKFYIYTLKLMIAKLINYDSKLETRRRQRS